MEFPKTLLEAIQYFSDEQVCIDAVASMRWPDGKVMCPDCQTDNPYYLASQKRWKCRNGQCARQFSVKVGTIFEDSPISLAKWLPAMWLLSNCKNGISSYELHRALGVTQKTAWFMLQRIRRVFKYEYDEKLGSYGPVEVDETFVSGKPQKMHRDRRLALKTGEFASKKTVVMGILDRDLREVRAKVIPNVKRETLQTEILNQVEKGSTVFTDGGTGYDNLAAQEYIHETVNHVEEYVRGQVHTQGIDNFWSLLKRGLSGTYVAVEPFHLDRYVDEQVFRYNNRATKDNPLTDSDRFALALSRVGNKRLTYAELTGKTGRRSDV
jgi:transposase-like protein